MSTPNPIDLRDQLLPEPGHDLPGAMREDAIRALLRRGWPVEAIVAEIPGVGEGEVRRVLEAQKRAA